uniref:uncharacterized protein n=1 Tax=Myxine glutinosa TaxID=7769 RepID=UPI00358E0C20
MDSTRTNSRIGVIPAWLESRGLPEESLQAAVKGLGIEILRLLCAHAESAQSRVRLCSVSKQTFTLIMYAKLCCFMESCFDRKGSEQPAVSGCENDSEMERHIEVLQVKVEDEYLVDPEEKERYTVNCKIGRPKKYQDESERLAARAKRARERRASQSTKCRSKTLKGMAENACEHRKTQSSLDRTGRLEQMSQHAREVRTLESPAKRKRRLQQMAQHARESRASESPEDRERRLYKMSQYAKESTASESAEHRKRRLQKKSQRAREQRLAESPSRRCNRLLQMANHARYRRINETASDKNRRVALLRKKRNNIMPGITGESDVQDFGEVIMKNTVGVGDLGPFYNYCQHCKAYKWSAESESVCCAKATVCLDPIPTPRDRLKKWIKHRINVVWGDPWNSLFLQQYLEGGLSSTWNSLFNHNEVMELKEVLDRATDELFINGCRFSAMAKDVKTKQTEERHSGTKEEQKDVVLILDSMFPNGNHEDWIYIAVTVYRGEMNDYYEPDFP